MTNSEPEVGVLQEIDDRLKYRVYTKLSFEELKVGLVQLVIAPAHAIAFR